MFVVSYCPESVQIWTDQGGRIANRRSKIKGSVSVCVEEIQYIPQEIQTVRPSSDTHHHKTLPELQCPFFVFLSLFLPGFPLSHCSLFILLCTSLHCHSWLQYDTKLGRFRTPSPSVAHHTIHMPEVFEKSPDHAGTRLPQRNEPFLSLARLVVELWIDWLFTVTSHIMRWAKNWKLGTYRFSQTLEIETIFIPSLGGVIYGTQYEENLCRCPCLPRKDCYYGTWSTCPPISTYHPVIRWKRESWL